jgi:hypothetical protein
MEIAVISAGMAEDQFNAQPWIHGQQQLRSEGIDVRVFRGRETREAFNKPVDAMLLYVWQDWMNRGRYDPFQIMPHIERQAAYRLRFPETVQIVVNHTDNSRHVYCLPYWRPGDPLLWRTPPYDRAELEPLPGDRIWAYEKVWTLPGFAAARPKYAAGFIGTPTGPAGYRARVARETAKVGIGICRDSRYFRWHRTVPYRLFNYLMARCRIVVCPRGWGPQSSRAWNAWLSGKPTLLDRYSATCELIPGVRLEAGVHFLVFDDPAEIPDIVREWTSVGREKDLAQIGENARRAALSYDAVARIKEFFQWVVPASATTSP